MHWQVKASNSWMIKSISKMRDLVLNIEYWEKSIQMQKFRTSDMYKEIRGINISMNWRNIFFQNYARP